MQKRDQARLIIVTRSHIPRALALETLDTIYTILFPFADAGSQAILRQLIAKEGYDPQFGARPLKRAIQDLLLDPLATKLLLGEFKPGDRIKVLAHDGELEFEKK